MHLCLPWAFHFHETVGVPPSPWSCVSLLIHSRFPSSSITICTPVDEQQGLVVQVQDKTYRSPACQEVADKPSYSKWSWQVGLQSHLELGVGVVNLLSLLLLSFWCGCAIQGALQFSWNFQPSATNCRRRQGFAFLTRADNLLSFLMLWVSIWCSSDCRPTFCAAGHSGSHLCKVLVKMLSVAYLPWHWAVCWTPTAQLIDSSSSANTSLL